MREVAMFPLGSVLFPHTPLLVRIFEPRYLTMLGRLLDEADPRFGVVLIERGREVGGGDVRTGIGTFARLIRVEAANEAMYAILGFQKAKCVFTPDDDCRTADSCFVTLLHIHHFHFETFAFRPAGIHAQKHSGPVTAFCTTGAAVYLEKAV